MSHPIEQACPKCGAEPGRPCVGKNGRERRAYHRERGSRRAINAMVDHGQRVDSPLEQDLLAAIFGWIEHHDAHYAAVATQVPVGPYRADIAIAVGDRCLIVEADGESFHNSREAVRRDKRRDRYFALEGHSVMRFTGDEIRRDPRGCAATVGLWIRGRK